MLQIGVIGSSSADDGLYRIAEEVGEEIAKSGCVLICGGLGGVMEAVSRGAKKFDGLTIGILPGPRKEDANRFIDVKIVTAMSHARNAIIAGTADILIAVGGELGTLSEISLGLKMGKHVIILKDQDSIGERIQGVDRNLHISKSPKDAVKLALKLGGEEI